MRFIVHTLFTLFVGSCVLASCQQSPDTKSASGEPIYLKNYQGKLIYLNYWAPWCTPCLTEMPELDLLYRKNPKRVMVIGVSYDKLPQQALRDFSQKYTLNFPLVSHFPLAKYHLAQPSTLPETLIINASGKLIHTFKGPQTYQALSAIISKKIIH